MFVKAEEVSESKVRYIGEDGSSVIYSGGNRPWRNQNPGNLGAGAWAMRHGAIGAAGKPGKKFKFAVFPNYEVGRAAIFSLLTSPDYINQTIWDVIPHYAHAGENDVAWYRKLVKQVTGLDLKRTIKGLSKKELEALVDAIERAEGKFKPGKIIKERAKKKITAVRKNKKGTIIGYYVNGLGWLSKPEAIKLALAGKIDVVVAHSRAGRAYLRTRPDWTVENNLDSMG
jgi:hypothetical protein